MGTFKTSGRAGGINPDQIKHVLGTSRTDLISQNGITEAFKTKADNQSARTPGEIIKFDKPRDYGIEAVVKGNLQHDKAGALPGVTVLVKHNDVALPAFPGPEYKIIGGVYSPNNDNYIFLRFVSDACILVNITVEL